MILNSYNSNRISGHTPLAKAFLALRQKNAVFRAALTAMRGTHRTYGDDPRAMLMVAPPGSGKTATVACYIAEYEKQTADEDSGVRYVVLDSKVTIGGLLSNILEALGDPAPTRGRVSELALRAHKIMRRDRIELLVIDEMHHVLPEHTSVRIQEATDTLKTLMTKGGAALILVGTIDTVRLLHASSNHRGKEQQFAQRCRSTYVFHSPAYGNPEWSHMMGAYQKMVGVPCVNLKSEDMLQRMYVATGGIRRRISDLFTEALNNYDSTRTEPLNSSDLASAYKGSEAISEYAENPFSCNKARLTEYLASAIAKHEVDLTAWRKLLINDDDTQKNAESTRQI